METKNTIICSKCLEKISDERICPLCGNDNSIDNPDIYLKAFTMLQDKYIVGKKITTSLENKIKQRSTQIFDKYSNLGICENVVINKPANMVVHPSILHRTDSLANAVKFYLQSKDDSMIYNLLR